MYSTAHLHKAQPCYIIFSFANNIKPFNRNCSETFLDFISPQGYSFCQTVKPYQRNCTPFFYFSTTNKPVITLIHTKKAALNLNYIIRTALENGLFTAFSRAVLFIFSPAVQRTRRDASLGINLPAVLLSPYSPVPSKQRHP